MAQLYTILGVVAVLLVLSVFASKAAVKLGVPTLLLFMALGIVAGSEGVGGLWFDYPRIAQGVGVVALVYILYAAGFDTHAAELRQQMWPALSLATIGVFVSCLLMAAFGHYVFGLKWASGVLLGAVVSSTDAAAVFSALRAKNTNLKPGLRHLIEAESGSNDPMAVFLTFAAITAVLVPQTSVVTHIGHFFLEMGLGAALGYLGGKCSAYIINHIRLEWEGLYPVLSIALVLLFFAICSRIGGNGFLGVYVAGLVVGNTTLIHRRSLLMFHDGIAWLLQIAMFLVLGLQVFPSQLLTVAKVGLLLSVFLIMVARPLSVLVALVPFRFTIRDQIFISWAGLRGAAPIILATIAVTNNVPHSQTLFNTVFFVAVLSVAAQGTTIDKVAKWLRVLDPNPNPPRSSFYFDPSALPDKRLMEFEVAPNSEAENKRIVDLRLPAGVLVLLIARGGEDVVPNGGTVLRRGDLIQVLADSDFATHGSDIFKKLPSAQI
jgi:cell volume regulation protein A